MSSTIKVDNVVNQSGDNDSGLDLTTNDQVIIKTANTTAVTVDSSQNTTFAGNITSTGIDDNASSTAITIDSSGNVGIGTSSPTAKVDLVDDGVQLRLANSTTGTTTSDGSRFQLSGNDLLLINRESANIQLYTADTERMRIDSSGNLLVGATTARTGTNTLSLEAGNSLIWFQKQNTDLQTQVVFNRNTQGSSSIAGTIQTTGTTVSYNTSSDYRLKENISYEFDATTRLKQLKPARFNWIQDETNTIVDGFIAHEVSSIVPEAISGEKDAINEDGSINPQGIDQSKLVPLLVKTIQELEARITALENTE